MSLLYPFLFPSLLRLLRFFAANKIVCGRKPRYAICLFCPRQFLFCSAQL